MSEVMLADTQEAERNVYSVGTEALGLRSTGMQQIRAAELSQHTMTGPTLGWVLCSVSHRRAN